MSQIDTVAGPSTGARHVGPAQAPEPVTTETTSLAPHSMASPNADHEGVQTAPGTGGPVQQAQQTPSIHSGPPGSTHENPQFRFPTVSGWPASFVGEADRLAAMTPQERRDALNAFTQPERETLASNWEFVRRLGDGLTGRDEEFAEAAARLMLHVPPETEEAATVRELAVKVMARLLRFAPDVARQMLSPDHNARVMIIPRGLALRQRGPLAGARRSPGPRPDGRDTPGGQERHHRHGGRGVPHR